MVPRSQEVLTTQVAKNSVSRITKKLSEEFSGTESRFLSALSQVVEFLLNQLIQCHSGSAPVTSRNTLGAKQRTNEDDSKIDPHPDASIS